MSNAATLDRILAALALIFMLWAGVVLWFIATLHEELDEAEQQEDA